MNWSHRLRHYRQMIWLALRRHARKQTLKHGGIGMQKNQPKFRARLSRCARLTGEGDENRSSFFDRTGGVLASHKSGFFTFLQRGARRDAPSIDTTSRLVISILALIAEFENEIRRERQMDGIAKDKDRGV